MMAFGNEMHDSEPQETPRIVRDWRSESIRNLLTRGKGDNEEVG